jgi:hypothetical protein
MGLKKRSLSRSSAACQAIFATKDQQLGVSHAERQKERPRLFRARRAAGERVV